MLEVRENQEKSEKCFYSGTFQTCNDFVSSLSVDKSRNSLSLSKNCCEKCKKVREYFKSWSGKPAESGVFEKVLRTL